MSILTTEIIIYGSAVMADDDTTPNVGGAINTAIKIEFTDITPSGTIEMLSAASGDTTQTVTVYGRNTSGELISEVKTLNGTNVISFSATFERIIKVVMSATATGTVTIRKASAGGDLLTLEPGITQIRRPFYNAKAPSSGSRYYYEKVFVKNTNGALTLTSAVISEYADPASKITFGLPDTLNDTGTADNRLTAPSAIVFDGTNKNVGNGQNLISGSAQGVWLKLTTASSDEAVKSSYSLRCEGNSI